MYLLVGLPGVGKYTVGRALRDLLLSQEDRQVRVVDNHWISNPILGLVEQDGVSPLPAEVWERIKEVRSAVLRTVHELSPGDWSFIFTAVALAGSDDAGWVEKLAAGAFSRGSRLVVVRLECELDELCRRVVDPSRRHRMKSINVDHAVQGHATGLAPPCGVGTPDTRCHTLYTG